MKKNKRKSKDTELKENKRCNTDNENCDMEARLLESNTKMPPTNPISSHLISLEKFLNHFHGLKGSITKDSPSFNTAQCLIGQDKLFSAVSSKASDLSPDSRALLLNKLANMTLAILAQIKDYINIFTEFRTASSDPGKLKERPLDTLTATDILIDMKLPLTKRFIEMRIYKLLFNMNYKLADSITSLPVAANCSSLLFSESKMEREKEYYNLSTNAYGNEMKLMRQNEPFDEQKVRRLIECLEMGAKVFLE